MPTNEITLHAIESLNALNDWFTRSMPDLLCISLQPLVVEAQPNIVPMSYFFQKNENEFFENRPFCNQ